MSAGNRTLTPEELYQKVWTTPIVRLSKELGISYADLLQLCGRHDIPRPKGGYWFRLAHGGASEQIALPPVPPGGPDEITIQPKLVPAAMPPQPTATKVCGTSAPAIIKGVSEQPKHSTAEQVVPEAVPTRLTRQELYDLVWKTTLKNLANQFGTTYVELVRACDELGVPRPDPGYWPRLKLGMPVAVVPLPEPPPGKPTEWDFGTKAERSSPARASVECEQPKEENEGRVATPENPGGIEARVDPTQAAAAAPAGKASTPDAQEVIEYTREQLYREVWSTPGSQLAPRLGISDVALAKTCRRLGIPRPPRRYWARIEAGEKLRKTALPPSKEGQDRPVRFNVAANKLRREEWAASNIATAGKGKNPEPVGLPDDTAELHPIAEKHRRALEKAKPGELGFVLARGKDLFHSEMSMALVPRFSRALHALICELEDRDFEFRLGSDEHEGLQILADDDQIGLTWSEAKLQVEREPTLEEKRRPSWTWQLRETKASGRLSIRVDASGLKGKREWTEGEHHGLEEVLGIIVEKIAATFKGFEERRKREAELAKRRQEEAQREAERCAQEEKQRNEQEKVRAHEAELQEVIKLRRKNLSVAAERF